jgi:serine-type D-Ala-D-Ala carboxypeptidase
VPELDTLIDRALARGLGSAMALSVGDVGREVLRMARGHTQRVPTLGDAIDDRTLFDVASLTKPMVTAACYMVLVGEGRVSLDSRVRELLPEAATSGTLRQLLGHAAGCKAHVEFFRTIRSHEALVHAAATEPADAPGPVYSDLGYILAGAVLERIVGAPLDSIFSTLVAEPLGLSARFVRASDEPLHAVATELDETMGRGLVRGRVHDENCYFGGGVCGHAGLFASLADVSNFAAALVQTHAGHPRGRFRPDVVREFVSTGAPGTSWRLGFDTPSSTPGVSHAGDRWPRTNSAGHLGFTGTSMWMDFTRARWSILLTNRVHPSRHAGTADEIKALRRSVNDAALNLLDAHAASHP